MTADPSKDPLRNPEVSYSYRETPSEVWRNRVGVTGTLFAVAMTLSYLLGRPRG